MSNTFIKRVIFTIFCLCCVHLSLLCEALSLSLHHLVEKTTSEVFLFNNGTLYSLSFGYPAAMAASISSKQRSHLPRRCRQADLVIVYSSYIVYILYYNIYIYYCCRQADLKSFGIMMVIVVMVRIVLVVMVVMMLLLVVVMIIDHKLSAI